MAGFRPSVNKRGADVDVDMGARKNLDLCFISYGRFVLDLVLDLVSDHVSAVVSDPRIISPFRIIVSCIVSYL